MLIEQRSYDFHPGRMDAWLEVYGRLGMPASDRHMGPSLGCFTTVIGPVNRFVFLRGYDDIDARDAGQAARAKDPGWQEFLNEGRALGALKYQESKFLRPSAFSPVQSEADLPWKRELPGTGMIVDHRTYDMHPGKASAWLDAYRDVGLAVQRRHLGQMLLFATTEVGPINQAVFMWAYESIGARERRRAGMEKDPEWAEFRLRHQPFQSLKQQTNQLLEPTSFSPVR